MEPYASCHLGRHAQATPAPPPAAWHRSCWTDQRELGTVGRRTAHHHRHYCHSNQNDNKEVTTQDPLIDEADASRKTVAVAAVVTVTVGPSPGFGAAGPPPPAAEPEPFTVGVAAAAVAVPVDTRTVSVLIYVYPGIGKPFAEQ